MDCECRVDMTDYLEHAADPSTIKCSVCLAALKAMQEDDWQPIETAPKDGSLFLVLKGNPGVPGLGRMEKTICIGGQDEYGQLKSEEVSVL